MWHLNNRNYPSKTVFFRVSAGQQQRRLVGKRVHARGVGIGHERHVGGFDSLPACDRGTVKEVAVAELGLAKR